MSNLTLRIEQPCGLIPAGGLLTKIELKKLLTPFTIGKTASALPAFDAVASMIDLQLQGHN